MATVSELTSKNIASTQSNVQTWGDIVVNVKVYGAKGDGVTDDTASIQAALDYAATNKLPVYCPAGNTYLVNSIRIKNGTVSFICDGVIKGAGVAVNGVVQLDGANLFAGTAVENCLISVNMDMSNGDREAIKADGCINCTFKNNHIYGFTNHATINHYGIILWYGSNYNKIINNYIVGYENPTQRGLLIDIIGEDGAEYGGFFNAGAIVDPLTPCIGNVISENILIYGSYAVNLLGCEANIVTNNYCLKQNHRAVYTATATNNCIINNNEFIGFISSAVLLSYGSHDNMVTDNLCKQIPIYNAVGGEGAIQVQTGGYNNTIKGNTIDSFTNYGIYFAINSIGNVADGNTIKNHYLCAIALENEWQDTPNVLAKYSRPNYGAPPIGTVWASKNSVNNVIQNNIIGACYNGRVMGAIYMSQLDITYSTSQNVIQNNIVTDTSSYLHHLYCYEETVDKMVNNTLKGNSFYNTTLSKIYLTRGRKHFLECFNNDAIDTDVSTFTDADTTPSVGIGGHFACANTGATSITFFDDGYSNQEILVRLDANTTIVYNSSLIRTKGAVNIAGGSTNNFVKFKLVSGNIWVELSRSF